MNASDYDGRTPLHLAAAEGHKDCVTFLLYKCDVNPSPTDRWDTTIHQICINSQVGLHSYLRGGEVWPQGGVHHPAVVDHQGRGHTHRAGGPGATQQDEDCTRVNSGGYYWNTKTSVTKAFSSNTRIYIVFRSLAIKH